MGPSLSNPLLTRLTVVFLNHLPGVCILQPHYPQQLVSQQPVTLGEKALSSNEQSPEPKVIVVFLPDVLVIEEMEVSLL